MGREARALFDDWGLDIDVDAPAGSLTVGQRQLLEIARALRQGSRFLILDEPTARLEAAEVERLFTHIRSLKAKGVSVLFISHYLDEVFELCDSVTVLRDGRKTWDAAVTGLTRATLIEAMVGKTASAVAEPATTERRATEFDLSALGARLEVHSLTRTGSFDRVTFRVQAGECLGLAGLAGSGKEALADALAGLSPWESGRVRVDECELVSGDVSDHNRAGLGFVPEDRHREGLVLGMSLAENATMSVPDRLPARSILGRLGFMSLTARDRFAKEMIKGLEIKAAGPAQAVSELSGGNQQKVVLARALARDPAVLVLVRPACGVDVASKAQIFAQIKDVTRRGTAALIISDELDELEVCDRILVMRQGRVTRELMRPYSPRALICEMEGAAA